MWEIKRKRYNKPDQEHYSISSKLKNEGKISDDFEVMLCNLSLEEIIGLRIELAAESVNQKLYGFNVWREVPNIAKEAVLKYAYSASRTAGEAALFLGIHKADYRKLLKKFNIKSFFKKELD